MQKTLDPPPRFLRKEIDEGQGNLKSEKRSRLSALFKRFKRKGGKIGPIQRRPSGRERKRKILQTESVVCMIVRVRVRVRVQEREKERKGGGKNIPV